MTRLGSFTTIDCPTKNVEEAFDFLNEQFEKIGGLVRKIINSHEFGSYPSFEVDFPSRFEELDDGDPDKEHWYEEANRIIEEYQKKFQDYL